MLKWSVKVYDPYTCAILNTKNQMIATLEGQGVVLAAERIVAAHNAVLDMAFDSPGNVS